MKKKVSILTILTLCLQLIPVLLLHEMANAAVNYKTVTIEESDSSITYSGEWDNLSGSGYSGGKAKFSKSIAASASFSFIGNGFRYMGTTNKYSLPISVSIDGVVVSTKNLMSTSTLNKQNLYEALDLAYGTHQVTIQTVPANNLISSQYVINLDSLQLFIEVPKAPEHLVVGLQGESVSLNWTEVEGAVNYKVYRSKNGVSGKQVISQQLQTNSFSDLVGIETITDDSTFYYEVSAIGISGDESSLSPKKSIVIPKNTATKPQKVVSINNDNKISLKWNASPNAVEYKVYRSTNKNGTYELINAATLIDAAYVDSSLEGTFFSADINYYYAVSAINRFGTESSKSSPIAIKLKATSGPLQFAAHLENGAAVLQWSSVMGAIGYKIYRYNPTTRIYEEISKDIITENRYSDTLEIQNIPSDFRQYYAVSAIDALNRESALSAKVFIVVPKNIASVPSNIKVVNNNNIIAFNWTAANNAVSYKVYRSTVKEGGYDLISGETLLPLPTYTDSSIATFVVSSGTKYYYAISSVNAFGVESKLSHSIAVTKLSPATAKSVTAAVYDGVVTVNWSAVSTAVSYKVSRFEKVDSTYHLLNESIVNSNSFTELAEPLSLPVDKRYYYAVNTIDQVGNASSLSNKAGVVIPKNAAFVPAKITLTNVDNLISLNWPNTENAIGYKVYRASSSKGIYELISGNSPILTNSFQDQSFLQVYPTSAIRYYYAVSAVNKYHLESNKSGIFSIDIVPHAGPEMLTAQFNSDTVMLEWKEKPGTQGYKIYRSTSASSGFTLLTNAMVQGNTFQDTFETTIAADKTYYYQVTAINEGNHESTKSKAANVIVPGNTASIPVSVEIAVVQNNQVTLSWSASSNATGYKVYRTIENSGITQLVSGESLITGTSVTEQVYNANITSYIYQVSAVNRFGTETNKSLGVSATVLPPAIPDQLTAQLNGDSTILQWAPVSSAQGYYIYRSEEHSSGFELLNNTMVTSLEYNDVVVNRTYPTNQTYYYTITAVDSTHHESGFSSVVNITVEANSADVPNGINAAINEKNEASITWSSANRAVGYKIYRKLGNAGEYELISGTNLITALNYKDSSLQQEIFTIATNYSYKITSVNMFGNETEQSTGVTVTFLPPISPTEFMASLISKMIHLQWSSVDGATGYKLYRSLQEVNGYSLVATLNGSAASFDDSLQSQTTDITYYYAISALDYAGRESVTSEKVPVLVLADEADVPTDVQATRSIKTISITWAESEYAEGYKVYRFINNTPQGELLNPNSLVATTNFVDHSFDATDIDQDTTISYKIAAVNATGKETVKSVPSSVILKKKLISPQLTVQVVNGIVNLQWSSVEGAISYHIYRNKFNSSAEASLIATESVTSNTYSDYSLTQQTVDYGTVYSYSISVIDEDSIEAPVSDVQTIVPPGNTATIPTGVQASVIQKTINLSWDSATNAAGYKVYRSTSSVDNSHDELISGQTPIIGTTYSDTSFMQNIIQSDVSYYYKVTSVNLFGTETLPSPFVTATLKATVTNSVPLVKNSDFEDYTTTTGVADGWLKFATSGAMEDIQMVNSPVNTGARAQKISSTYIPVNGYVMTYQKVPVVGNRYYEVSGQYKIDSLTNAKVQLYIDYFDAAKKVIGGKITDYATITNGYVNISHVASLPANTDYIVIYSRLASKTGVIGSGTFYVDSINLKMDVNPIVNGDFENITGTDADGWLKYTTAGATGETQVVTSPISSGTKALKITGSQMPNAATVMEYQKIPALPGQGYKLSAKFKIEALNNSKAELYVDYFDVSAKYINRKVTALTQITNGYVDVTATDVVPAGTSYITIYSRLTATANDASGTFYVDSLQFTIGVPKDNPVVVNPSFESYTGSNGVADGWLKFATAGTSENIQVVNSPTSDGLIAQKVSGTNLSLNSYTMVYQSVKVLGNRNYEISGKFNIESLTNAKVQLYMDYFDFNKKIIGGKITNYTGLTNGYITLSHIGSLPINTDYVVIYAKLIGTGPNGSGTFYVDDFSLKTDVNPIVNPDFEINSVVDIADAWTKYTSPNATGDTQVVNSPVSAGNKALKIVGTSMQSGTRVMEYQKIAAFSDQVYTLSAKFNVVQLNNAKAELFVDFFDAANVYVGSKAVNISTITTGYVDIKMIGSAPANTASVVIYARLLATGDNGSGTFYADSFQYINN